MAVRHLDRHAHFSAENEESLNGTEVLNIFIAHGHSKLTSKIRSLNVANVLIMMMMMIVSVHFARYYHYYAS